jgi:hypothetical protein
MAFITADRVKDTSTTTGTGNITVSGSAPFGYQTFSTVLSVSDTFYYCIQGQSTSEWEVGLGTYVSSNQFARTTILSSSASGSAVSFSSGTKNVFITLPANKTLQFDVGGSPTSGGILYGAGTMLSYSAVGTAGQVLVSGGSGAPTWSTVTGLGTVTSVNVSGGSTGLTYSGGPITNSGTITMAGTLAVANGGTGLTTAPANGALDIGNGTGFTRTTLTAGSNITITNGAGSISIASTGGGGTPGGSTTQVQYNNAGAFAGSSNLTFDGTNLTSGGTVAMASSFKRNRIINGNMSTDQRNAGAAQTITAAAALAYTVDRFYAYCTGANVTGQQIAGATANQYRYRFTGAASVTAIGFAQRIEAINSADLASTTATLSVDLANSLLTTVTWTAYYANTTDTFGTLASPTVTSIATGTFTVTSTVTRYNAQISIPSAATTGLQILFTVGAQTSGTWTIGNVQLEPGSVATPYERQIYGDQLSQCQRYYQLFGGTANGFGVQGYATAGNNSSVSYAWPVTTRVAPTVTVPTMTNINTTSIVPNSPSQYGVIFTATATATGSLSSLNTGAGTGSVSAEL